MQNYINLQNKLRQELANRWVQYYAVDGLNAQKNSTLRFTPTTALQGAMFQVAKELDDLETILLTKNVNDTPQQAVERGKQIITPRYQKLVELHKQATKRGILGKDESLNKLLARHPELKNFINKYVTSRDSQEILLSLDPEPTKEAYETNLAKANLAEEYQSKEFKEIQDFLKMQKEKIDMNDKAEKADEQLGEMMDAFRIMERSKNKPTPKQEQKLLENMNQYLAIQDRRREAIDEGNRKQQEDEEFEDDDVSEAPTVSRKITTAQKPKPKPKPSYTTNQNSRFYGVDGSPFKNQNHNWDKEEELEEATKNALYLKRKQEEKDFEKRQGEAIQNFRNDKKMVQQYGKKKRESSKKANEVKKKITDEMKLAEINKAYGFKKFQTLDEVIADVDAEVFSDDKKKEEESKRQNQQGAVAKAKRNDKDNGTDRDFDEAFGLGRKPPPMKSKPKQDNNNHHQTGQQTGNHQAQSHNPKVSFLPNGLSNY
jgi:hypothetical protein